MGDALAAQPQHRTDLRRGRNAQARTPLERGHLDLAAQRGLAEGDRNLADHVVADAAKQRLRLDLDQDLQIPGGLVRARTVSGAAHAAHAARLDPGRDLHLQATRALAEATASTRAARL